MSKPTAILTADIHLRDDTPVCRTDDYWAAQQRKIGWLFDLQTEHGCPILDAGDLLHHWKPSPYLLAWAILNMPGMITIAGNHDLPQHNAELIGKSGLAVLEAAEILSVLWEPYNMTTVQVVPYPWGTQPKALHRAPPKGMQYRVALCHTMVWEDADPFPNASGCEAHAMLEAITGYDLIVTGDNHKPFAVEQDGRWLVNPGSLMRMTAAQADHEPGAYLWYAEEGRVERVLAPFVDGVISRDHIRQQEQRSERMEAFVATLDADSGVEGLDFPANVEAYMEANSIVPYVREKVWQAMGTE